MFMKKRLVQISGILVATTLLVGCDSLLTLNTSAPAREKSQQEKSFAKKYYLCQSSGWATIDDNNVFLAEESGRCSYYTPVQLPSFQAYQQDQAYWKDWHHQLTGHYRILGTVDKDTSYHVTKVIINGKKQTRFIMIDSGPFTGTKVEVQPHLNL